MESYKHKQNEPADISLPEAFPKHSYTPFGYLDNPAHSSVFNRSGIIRSVPPIGFGFWCRKLPWTYTEGLSRYVNYLSFFDLAVQLKDVLLQTSDDFTQLQANLRS